MRTPPIVHRLVAALTAIIPVLAAVVVAGLTAGLGTGCDADEVVPHDAPIDSGGCGDCDAPNDASEFCNTCTEDQVCVQFIDGVCGQISLRCEPRNVNCASNLCTPGCMQWQCNNGNDPPFYRCDVGGCPVAVPGALHCYGP